MRRALGRKDLADNNARFKYSSTRIEKSQLIIATAWSELKAGSACNGGKDVFPGYSTLPLPGLYLLV